MSFREKSAWIAVVLYLATTGYYVWTLYEVILAGQTETFEYGSLLISLIVVMVIATIVLEAVAAGASPKEANAPADEREKLIALKATNVAYTFLIIGALWAAGATAVGKPSFYTANGLYLAVVFSEIVRHVMTIVRYRRGA